MEDSSVGHLPADHSISSPGSRAKQALAGLSMLVRGRIHPARLEHGTEMSSRPVD